MTQLDCIWGGMGQRNGTLRRKLVIWRQKGSGSLCPWAKHFPSCYSREGTAAAISEL